MKPLAAWCVSLLLGAPGCVLLVLGAGDALRTVGRPVGTAQTTVTIFCTWALYLLLSRVAYAAYNRIDAERRSFPYAVLQLSRTAGYGVLLVSGPVGVVVLGALVLARWFPYMTYRDLGEHPKGSHRLTMLLAFLVLAAVQASMDLSALWSLQAAAVLLYFAARAHRPLRHLVRR